jgi:hypothetical protein
MIWLQHCQDSEVHEGYFQQQNHGSFLDQVQGNDPHHP